ATVLLVVAACLAVFGLWVNASLAILNQRLYNPADVHSRVGMLGFQYDVDKVFGGTPRQAPFVPALPDPPARAGTTAVVGNCASVYWSDGRAWRPVEGSNAGGWFRFRTHPGPAAATAWQPVVSWGTPAKHDVVGLRRFGDGYHVGLGLQQPNGGLMWFDTGVPIPASSVPFDLAVHVDQSLRDVSATADGKFAADYPRVQEM